MRGGFIWCCIFRSGAVSVACGRATLSPFLPDSLSFVFCRLLLCSHSRHLCSLLSPCLGWSRLIKMPANTRLQPPLIFPAFSLLHDPHILVEKNKPSIACANDQSLWYSTLFLSRYIGCGDHYGVQPGLVEALGPGASHLCLVPTSATLILSPNRDLLRSKVITQAWSQVIEQ